MPFTNCPRHYVTKVIFTELSNRTGSFIEMRQLSSVPKIGSKSGLNVRNTIRRVANKKKHI